MRIGYGQSVPGGKSARPTNVCEHRPGGNIETMQRRSGTRRCSVVANIKESSKQLKGTM